MKSRGTGFGLSASGAKRRLQATAEIAVALRFAEARRRKPDADL